jgi:hypothetical protein
MPGGQTVEASAAFAAGLRTSFLSTYRPRKTASDRLLALIMDLDLPSDKLTETYVYPTSVAHVRRREKGEPRHSKPFEYISFSVTNRNWQAGCEWFDQDRDDDQTKSLESQANGLGQRFGILDERAAFQLITAGTDAELLPAIPNAPDGAAFYSATAGGVDRFGVSGGNIITGTGVATTGAVRADLFNAVERALAFEDTNDQPYHDESAMSSPIVVAFNVANLHVWTEAVKQVRTTGAVGQVSGIGGVTNPVMDGGLNIVAWPTPYITDNDAYVFLTAYGYKSTFSQARGGMEIMTQTKANSDIARSTGREGVFFEKRGGYGLALPINTVKINN